MYGWYKQFKLLAKKRKQKVIKYLQKINDKESFYK